MDGWMNEWMNNPCSLIIYRNHVDESSQAKVLNLFHFSELYSNRGLSVNPKTTHQWWGYHVRLAGKCGGHTMRIHVLMAMQRLTVSFACSLGSSCNHQGHSPNGNNSKVLSSSRNKIHTRKLKQGELEVDRGVGNLTTYRSAAWRQFGARERPSDRSQNKLLAGP